MNGEAPSDEIRQVLAMHRIAVELRRDADPLLRGQYDAVVGRITALLAALGAPPPNEEAGS